MNIILKTVGVTFFSTFFLSLIYQNQHIIKKEEQSIVINEKSIDTTNIDRTKLVNEEIQKQVEKTAQLASQIKTDNFIELQLSKFDSINVDKYNAFKYITVSNIEENPKIAEHYQLDNERTTKKLQDLSMYISKKYSVPINLAEKIIYYTHDKSLEQKIDPLLLLSIISVESTFRPQSKSHAGAIGLTQVIPRWHPEKIEKLPPNQTIWSIPGNIFLGATIIKKYLRANRGNLILALQKYNGSSHDETRKYSRKVLNKYRTYKRAIQFN